MEHKLIRTEMPKLSAVCITWGTPAINVNTGKLGKSLLVQIQPHQLCWSQPGAGNAPHSSETLQDDDFPCRSELMGRTGHKQARTCS